MSTYWYHECLDHEPPLRAAGEFTQHTDDDAYRHGVALMAQRPLLAIDYDSHSIDFDLNAREFLVAHPKCRISLVNEYGERADP